MSDTRDRRSVLFSAFSFVRSMEANKASAAITIDHVLDQQVKFLKKDEKRTIVDASGAVAGTRASRYDQLQRLKDDLAKVVEDLKSSSTEDSIVENDLFGGGTST